MKYKHVFVHDLEYRLNDYAKQGWKLVYINKIVTPHHSDPGSDTIYELVLEYNLSLGSR